MDLILASQSPRRRELLAVIQPNFKVVPSIAEEIIPDGYSPAEAVEHLARLKASQVAKSYPDCLVIGADTVVAIDGRILGKPRNREDCLHMLHLLSGRIHQVYTGVALSGNCKLESFVTCTKVEFWPLTEDEISAYASTEEPYDKAGAYGIQGLGSLLVKGIEGDYFNVMGLPVSCLNRHMADFNKI